MQPLPPKGLCPNTRGTFQPLGWALLLTKQEGQEPPPRVAPAVMVVLPPQQGGRMHPSRARATVAPLQVGLPPAGSGSLPLSPSQGKAIPESKM